MAAKGTAILDFAEKKTYKKETAEIEYFFFHASQVGCEITKPFTAFVGIF